YGRLRFANKLLGDRYRRRFNRGYLLEDCLRLFLAFVRLRASQVSAILTGRRQFWQTADLPAARESLQKRRQVADESLFALQKTFPSPLIWGGAPVLTWDIIQSVYLPLIQAQETRPLPEFPASYRITIPPSSSLQRWNRIRQLEGTVMLFQHIYRAVQRRLAIP
ncbi:MAG TPA: hypothetical protein VN363_01735, partial [Anaerolineales bacterium]|nr:hypothetical protein [Anaerolineales bacterium]